MKFTFRTAATLALALLMPASLAVAPADAASSVCSATRGDTLMGIDFGALDTDRSCLTTRGTFVSGSSDLGTDASMVLAGRNSDRQLVKETMVHELTHQVDWQTSRVYRARLYAFLGYQGKTGSFFSVPSPAANWDGRDLNVWKSDPHERLAESVVQCAGGTPRVDGMKLVRESRCDAFLTTFQAAVDAVDRP